MYINVEYLILAGFILFMVIGVANFVDILKIKRRYRLFKSGTNNENMEIAIEKYIHLVEDLKNKNLIIENRLTKVENCILNNIQKIGVKRYNAFDDMSNNLSFSVALLDANNTGVIITELYLRNSSTVYIREIKNGICEIRLSEEEREAIENAQKYMIKK